MDLSKWLEERAPDIAARWGEALEASGGSSWDGGLQPVRARFCQGLLSFLPGSLTPYRHQVEPLWAEVAEMFGSVAARRGLSAGEVIEEFQMLREVILRVMFEHPPIDGGRRLSLRELLQLNRALDSGVTQASVGHTDLLFFSLIHGSGVPAPMEQHDIEEVCEQIRTLEEEGRRIMRHLSHVTGT